MIGVSLIVKHRVIVICFSCRMRESQPALINMYFRITMLKFFGISLMMGGFVVLEFEDGIQIAPSSWLDSTKKQCYWPNYTQQSKINNAIYNDMEPDIDHWPLHRVVRIFCSARTHEEAKQKLKVAEVFSDIDSVGKDEAWKKNMRREHAKRQLSSSESDYEIVQKKKVTTCKTLPPMPSVPTISKRAIDDNTNRKIPSSKQHTSVGPKVAREESLASSLEEDDYISLIRENVVCSTPTLENRSVSKAQSSKEKTSLTTIDLSVIVNMLSNLSKSMLENTIFQKVILRKLNTIIHKQNTLDSKMELLEQQGHVNEAQTRNVALEHFGLPLADEGAIEMLEKELEKQEVFQSFIQSLRSIGGSDVHSCTVNILKRMFTNTAAELYSWAGAKRKRSFKDLHVFQVIFRVVRIHINTVTEKQLSEIIGKWLVQAKARRERKKPNPDNDQSVADD